VELNAFSGEGDRVVGFLKINTSSRDRILSIGFYANDIKSIKDALYMLDRLEYSVLEYVRNARSMLTDFQTELCRREG